MDLEYFKCQIMDELCGAEAYIKHAIELRAMSQTWSKLLVEMSAAELQHATNLYKMFEEFYQKMSANFTEVPDYAKDIKDEIIEMYTEKYAYVKYMHEAFTK